MKFSQFVLICVFICLSFTAQLSAQTYLDGKQKADTELSQGNFSSAISSFQKLLVDYPQKLEAYNALGFAYYLNGEFDQAIQTFETALNKTPNDDSIQRNLIFFKANGSSRAAVTAFSQHGGDCFVGCRCFLH